VSRREFVALLSAVAVWPVGTVAQQAERVYRVGYLEGGSEAATSSLFAVFRQGLHELGYVEGRNLVFHTRFADGKLNRFPLLAQDLVHLKPDVVFVVTNAAARATKAATITIPVVFIGVGDPVRVGLVPSLARPGGNITGITNVAVELTGKRLELLKEVVPTASQIAVLMNPDAPIAASQLRDAQAAALRLGVHLHPVIAIRSAEDLEGAFETAVRSGAGAVLRMVDFTERTLRPETVKLAMKHRLPVMYPFRENVDVGGLISYGVSFSGQYKEAATYVDKILKGAKPGDLPVEQPTKFEMIVNLKTAKALNLTVPSTLLARADEVIE
jgi:putative tryptophan/tyrosine transport system substrate-binding protein